MRRAHDQFQMQWGSRLGVEGLQLALQDGIVPSSAAAPVTASVQIGRVAEALAGSESIPPGIELSVIPDYAVFDGRFARNPWLQEMPDPITKVTWDNCLMISPATARRLELEPHEQVRLEAGGRKTLAAVNIVQGQAEDTVTLSLGYGRPELQGEGEGPVGFDAYPLRTSRAPWFIPDVRITALKDAYRFAITQGGDLSQQGRELAIAVDGLRPARGQKALREHRDPQDSLYPRALYAGYQWALSIDLSRCTGCSACVVACVAENNIPTVGKENVANGREMQWIRVDRYLEGGRAFPGGGAPAHPVHALRERALRVRLPGERHRPLRRGPQRDGLQPLRRHPLLLEQLPLQGPALQLPGLQRDLTAAPGDAEEPGGDGPKPRRDGEVHLLRAADREGEDRRGGGGPPDCRRRDPHGVPAGLSREAIVFGTSPTPPRR